MFIGHHVVALAVGLGLWNFILATIALELAMFFAGLVLYLRVTRAKDCIGTWAFCALIVFLLALYASVCRRPVCRRSPGWGC